jgi:hypothetical protein
MKGVKEQCLSCKFYHLQAMDSGICRVDKGGGGGEYPAKQPEELCPKWRDSGQQYFIRVGWIKARKAAGDKETAAK